MNDEEQAAARELRSAFLMSRTAAILRCAEIMVDENRKDLARQILKTTNIDRDKLDRLKANHGL